MFTAPDGCNCEAAPQPTEYDYLPTPSLTSLTATPAANGDTYASEQGGTTVTLTGAGFDLLGLEWVDEGAVPTSLILTPSLVTPTELQFQAAAVAPSVAVETAPISVQTFASPNSGNIGSTVNPSNTLPLAYAGVPSVTSVSTPTKIAGGPAQGGTKVTIRGSGFTAAVAAEFYDRLSTAGGGPAVSLATDYNIDVVSDSEITLTSPAANPGTDDLFVCTTTVCSSASSKDTYIYYAPGNPSVASSSPTSGPAKGGTKVTITGTALGCVTAVKFGSVSAKTFANPKGYVDCGDTTHITVTAPAGKAGTKVLITVETQESEITGYGFSHKAAKATFTYKS